MAPAKKAELVQLAAQWADALGLDGEPTIKGDEGKKVLQRIAKLDKEDQGIINQIIAVKAMSKAMVDSEGLGELCGCAHH